MTHCAIDLLMRNNCGSSYGCCVTLKDIAGLLHAD